MRARTPEEIRVIAEGIARVGRLSDGLVGRPGSAFRLGIDPLVNLIPGMGPLYTSVTGLYLLIQAWRAHVPLPTIAAMWACMAVDGVVGSIPLVGILGDFVWRGQGMAARLALDAIGPVGDRDLNTDSRPGFVGRMWRAQS